MRRLRTVTVLTAVLAPLAVHAQELRYGLEVEGVECDGELAAPPGATVFRVPVTAYIDTPVAGAQGFVMGISCEASDVVMGTDPCPRSCASEIVVPGGRGDEVVFNNSTALDPQHVPTEGPLASGGPQGPGFTAYIALNIFPRFLLGTGRTNLTKFWVEVPVPDRGEERMVRLSFRDGLQLVTRTGPVAPAVNQVDVRLKLDENPVTFYPSLGECTFSLKPFEGGVKPGDFSLDDSVDLTDAVVLLHHLALGNPPTAPCEGTVRSAGNVALLDSNGDDYVDISDAIYLLAHLFLGTAPHVLGRACVDIEGCPVVCERSQS